MELERKEADRRKDSLREEVNRWAGLEKAAQEEVIKRGCADKAMVMSWALGIAEAAYPTENIDE